MRTAIDTTPYWTESASLPRFAALDRDADADVVVVGGGITGLTAAYLLLRAGKSVVLLERERCAQIDSGHTSAHLTFATDQSLTDLVKSLGKDHARATWDAGLAALAQIDEIVRSEKVDCDFGWVPGYRHDAPGEPTNASLKRFGEEAALASELGFDVSFVDQVPFVGGPGMMFEDQARFHPRKYLAGLARAVERLGGRIHEHSAADEFSDTPRTVKSNGHPVGCRWIVLATHTPLVGTTDMAKASRFQTKLALYTTYVVGGRAKKGVVPDALFWDSADPYHYLRIEPHRDFDFVLFGGEDHKTGQVSDTSACYDRLTAKLTALVPSIDMTHRWSGQVIETPDGLPYIGETADHQFAATGYSGNGLTFGTLGAMMACDRVLGRSNPWAELFDTARASVRTGLWDYLRENKDYPYYMIRDRFAGTESRSLRAVKRGEGKILEFDGQPAAVYRDESGKAIQRSAICTHMGCRVAWNGTERTWDCPCHGSRFQTDGSVISGPAESPLPEK